jgi:hypothetical protein
MFSLHSFQACLIFAQLILSNCAVLITGDPFLKRIYTDDVFTRRPMQDEKSWTLPCGDLAHPGTELFLCICNSLMQQWRKNKWILDIRRLSYLIAPQSLNVRNGEMDR